jgi:hypothetical protein
MESRDPAGSGLAAYSALLPSILSFVAAVIGNEAIAPGSRWLLWVLLLIALFGSLSFWLQNAGCHKCVVSRDFGLPVE